VVLARRRRRMNDRCHGRKNKKKKKRRKRMMRMRKRNQVPTGRMDLLSWDHASTCDLLILYVGTEAIKQKRRAPVFCFEFDPRYFRPMIIFI
jgi:hypothetical protein